MRQVEKREDKRLRWQWQISFNRKETDMKSNITIIPSGNYHILIKGLRMTKNYGINVNKAQRLSFVSIIGIIFALIILFNRP